MLVNQVDWNADRTNVRISAKGADIEASVDAVEVHVSCDVPMLSKLLGGSVVDNLKGLVEERFQKKLTDNGKQ